MRRSYLICTLLLFPGCTKVAPQQKDVKQPAAAPGAVASSSSSQGAATAPTASKAAAASAESSPGKGNPFAKSAEAVVEGRKLYLTYGCVGCHGVSGGGGMGKPILDDEWVFGSDDATLFKLIRGQIPDQKMPSAIGQALTDDQIWKVLTYVRHVYQGDPSKINWVVPPPVSEEQLASAGGGTTDPVAAGKPIFMAACAPCHGQGGKGDGPDSKKLNPKPRNLTDAKYMAALNDRYLFELVSRGGIAVGKSSQMPQFALDHEQITNVIAYVRTLSGTGNAASAPASTSSSAPASVPSASASTPTAPASTPSAPAQSVSTPAPR